MKLQKTLKTWDVILLNVTAVIGLRWISLAAGGGNTSITLWGMALLFFFIPQIFAVIDLTKRMPGEGGIYLWAKEAFGDFHGFIAGWCYWTNNLVYFPNLLVYIAGISVFVAGAKYAGYGADKSYIMIFSLSALFLVMVFNYIGLKFGKWVNNIGGIGTWATGIVLILFGVIAFFKFGSVNTFEPESFFTGILSMDKLIFWSSMCFAFTGIELASLLADEVHDADKTIPRASILSGIIISAIYVIGTFVLIISLPTEEINIITGILQAITAIGNKIGLGWASPVIAFLITLGGIGGLMAWFTGAARMPFVAGIDRYLPKSFGELHPKYGTPYKAIVVQAIVAALFIVMSFIGSTVEEAYIILLDTALLVYFIPYLYMFTAYIYLQYKDSVIAQVSPIGTAITFMLGSFGLLTTVFAMIVALFPPPETANPLLFELKVVGGALGFFCTGAAVYFVEKRKQSRK